MSKPLVDGSMLALRLILLSLSALGVVAVAAIAVLGSLSTAASVFSGVVLLILVALLWISHEVE